MTTTTFATLGCSRLSRRRWGRKAMSFVELMVALAVASIFLVGIVGALSALLHAASQAEREGEAVRQARLALDKISEDLTLVSPLLPPLAALFVTDNPLPTGDFIDNDGDGQVDEEDFDGRNDDGGPLIQKHAVIDATTFPTPTVERPRQALTDDLGDEGVDEDTVFQRDTLTFQTLTRRIEYRVDAYDGRDNVLVREVTNITLPIPTSETSAVAYDVVSFNVLSFDPNWIVNGEVSPWEIVWSSLSPGGLLGLPPTVHISVAVYSGERPLAELPPGSPIPNIALETQATLEAALFAYLGQLLPIR
jgi:type II secretory pathway pseudopilin PulG